MSTYGPRSVSDSNVEYEWGNRLYYTLGRAKGAKSNRINRIKRWNPQRAIELGKQPIRWRTVERGDWEDVDG